METYDIQGYLVTFNNADHQYTVNGKAIISVTQLIDRLLGKPYKRVDPVILEKAAQRGNELHDMIERYERFGEKTMHKEMATYLGLKKQHQFDVLESEKIVLIMRYGQVIAAGRFDMVVSSPFIKGQGIADVKRSLHLDETRLKLQLNLYKLGYEQTYRKKIHYLKCLHIRNRQGNYLDVPTDRAYVETMLDHYLDTLENSNTP